MNISISNIAWNREEEPEVVAVMQELGICGVDIAPPKVWTDPLATTAAERKELRHEWEERGITIIGAQSIHFGHPELQLFTSPDSREQLFDFTKRMIALCGDLGVQAIVFGSPKNRVRGKMPMDEAMDIAADFFLRLGEEAAVHHTVICIEPNAAQYGCDFITTSIEGLELVQRVNHPGFRLHLDAGAMTLMNEDIPERLKLCSAWMNHFHISEPMLRPVGDPSTTSKHQAIATALRLLNYQRWVSIEMTADATLPNSANVRRALTFVQQIYTS